jgi:hypothetical protein
MIPAGTRLKLRRAQKALIENFPRGYRAVGLVAQTPEFWEADGRYEFFRRAFRTATFNGISGDYVEFGCDGCRTFSQAFYECAAPGSDVRSGRSTLLPGFHRTISMQASTRSGSAGGWATGIADFHRLAERKGLPRESYRTVEGFYDRTIGPDASYGGPLPDDSTAPACNNPVIRA